MGGAAANNMCGGAAANNMCGGADKKEAGGPFIRAPTTNQTGPYAVNVCPRREKTHVCAAGGAGGGGGYLTAAGCGAMETL